MKKLIYSISTVAALVLIGCGGSSHKTTKSASVSGTVQASYLEGVKVCVKNTNNCAVTDKNGKFELNASLPVEVEVKVGDTVIGDVNITSKGMAITPAVLAENNETVAAYLGATIHMVAGCDLDAQNCDLSNVEKIDINENENKPLVDEIKEAVENGEVHVKVKKDGEEVDINVTEENATVYKDHDPIMCGEKLLKYNGLISGEGFLNFEIDPETLKLTYEIRDFNNTLEENGTAQLVNVYHNVFFTFKDNNESKVFISKTMAFGYDEDEDEFEFEIGLQRSDKNLTQTVIKMFINKRYNSFEVDTEGNYELGLVDINSTNASDMNGTWKEYASDGTYNGYWRVEQNHINFYTNDGELSAYAFIKPGKRVSVIYGTLEGDVGIGLEAKPLSNKELKGRYYYLSEGEDFSCYGKVDINGTNISFEDENCSDNDPESGSATLSLNPTIEINSTNYKLNGIASFTTEDNSTVYTIIDPEDGYFIAVNPKDQVISIGSNQPLK